MDASLKAVSFCRAQTNEGLVRLQFVIGCYGSMRDLHTVAHRDGIYGCCKPHTAPQLNQLFILYDIQEVSTCMPCCCHDEHMQSRAPPPLPPLQPQMAALSLLPHPRPRPHRWRLTRAGRLRATKGSQRTGAPSVAPHRLRPPPTPGLDLVLGSLPWQPGRQSTTAQRCRQVLWVRTILLFCVPSLRVAQRFAWWRRCGYWLPCWCWC